MKMPAASSDNRQQRFLIRLNAQSLPVPLELSRAASGQYEHMPAGLLCQLYSGVARSRTRTRLYFTWRSAMPKEGSAVASPLIPTSRRKTSDFAPAAMFTHKETL